MTVSHCKDYKPEKIIMVKVTAAQKLETVAVIKIWVTVYCVNLNIMFEVSVECKLECWTCTEGESGSECVNIWTVIEQ